MRIGELPRPAGTTPQALRFYEEQGLLPAGRAANGYRDCVHPATVSTRHGSGRGGRFGELAEQRRAHGTQAAEARLDRMLFRGGEPVAAFVGARAKARLFADLDRARDPDTVR